MPAKPYTARLIAVTTTETPYEIGSPGNRDQIQLVLETEWEIAHTGLNTSRAAALDEVCIGWDATAGTPLAVGSDKDVLLYGAPPIPVPPGTKTVYLGLHAAALSTPLVVIRPVGYRGGAC